MNRINIPEITTENRQIACDKISKEVLLYRYLLVYGMSQRVIGATDALLQKGEIDWQEVVEFRCFDEYGEIHGILNGSMMNLYEVRENSDALPQEKYIEKEFSMTKIDRSSLIGVGNADTLIVRRYIDYDKDGQASICLSRLYGFKG